MGIAKWSDFSAEMAVYKTFEELKLEDSKLKAYAKFLKLNNAAAELQEKCEIMIVENEAQIGKWLKDNYPAGGDKPSKNDKNFEVQSKGELRNSDKALNEIVNNLPNSETINAGLPAKMPVSANKSSNARLLYDNAEIRKKAINNLVEENKAVENPSKRKPITVLSVTRGIREIIKEQVKENVNDVKLDTEKKYRVFYADPPWKYNSGGQQAGKGKVHTAITDMKYPSMSIDELCAMPIKDMTEKNAVLFLWVTSPLLAECFDVIKAWGFTYKASMIWDKVKHNVGYYVSTRHELLLICVKGSCMPDVKTLYDSVYEEARTVHSKKPVYFRNLIDMMYTKGKRIELFAREKVDGWSSFGNQL